MKADLAYPVILGFISGMTLLREEGKRGRECSYEEKGEEKSGKAEMGKSWGKQTVKGVTK